MLSWEYTEDVIQIDIRSWSWEIVTETINESHFTWNNTIEEEYINWTWRDLSWILSTWSTIEEQETINVLWDLIIIEIQVDDTDVITEYIAIQAKTAYIWEVTILWLWRWGWEKKFSLHLGTWEIVYIVDKEFITNKKTLQLDSISLKNDWDSLQIKNASWLVLDEVVYELSLPGKSLFYWDTKWTSRVFNTTGAITLVTTIETNELPQEEDVVWPEEEIPQDVLSTGGAIFITEIHPKDTAHYPEFIELFINGPYIWDITIAWLWHWSASKELFLSWSQSKRILLTDQTNHFIWFENVYHIPSISLTDAWEEIIIYWQGWQVLDSVVYTSPNSNESIHLSWFNVSTREYFSWYPSPWISYEQTQKIISQFITKEPPSCWIQIQNNDAIVFPKKINPIATVNNKQITNWSSLYTCVWETTWSDIVSDVCNPSFFSYDNAWVYSLWLTVFTWNEKVCSTHTSINYPDTSLEKTSATESTYYKNLYLKRKEKYTQLKNENNSPVVEESSLPFVVYTWALDIVWVMPNPAWKDTSNELLRIKNKTSNEIQLSEYRLHNWKNSLALDEMFIQPFQEITLTWSLWLYNRPACISLVYAWEHYSPFCYSQAKDDERIDTSLPFSSNLTTQDISLLDTISLETKEENVCIVIAGTSYICKDVWISKDNTSSLTKTQKKYDLLEENLKKQKEKYTTLVDTNTLIKKQLRLSKDFIYILTQSLYDDRWWVYTQSPLWSYKKYYDELYRSIWFVDTRYWISLSELGMKNYIDMQESRQLPLEHIDILQEYEHVFMNTRVQLDSFLKNLTHEE